MDSQAAEPVRALGKGEKLGPADAVGCGIDEQGQASPREMPLMAVREGGQMGAKPVIKTSHRVGRDTMGIEEACVEGWDRR